jgi:hypothetical protein
MVVKIEYKNSKGNMTIDLNQLINVSHSIVKTRKLFKMMVQNMDEPELNQVQIFLNSSSKKYALEFQKILADRK